MSENKPSTDKYKNILSATYIIPLVKNKAGINTTLDTDLALINQKIGNLQVKINPNNFINNSLKKFWKMKFLEHKVNIANKSLANGKRQLNLINQRFKSNLVDKSDVLLQTNNYQNQNISLMEAQRELQNLTGIKIKNNDLKLEKIIDVVDGLEINNLNTIKILEFKKTKIHREMRSLSNQSKPKVDLSLGMQTVRSSKSIFSSSTKNDNILSVGFSIAFPLKKSLNSGLISKKQNELRILNLSKKDKILELQDSNDSSLMQLSALKKILDINKEQLIINTTKTQEFEKKYANGNTELRYMIESQINEQNVKLSYFSNLFKYHSLQLDYKNLLF